MVGHYSHLFLALLVGLLALAGAGASGNSFNYQIIRQGISGKIILREGNFMLGPNRSRQPQGKPAVREIQVYRVTQLSQVKESNGFYSHLQTKLVAKVYSSPEGTFQISLKPGQYSVFTKEPRGLYANLLDAQGNIFPVEVKAHQITPVEFVIDYNASY